MAIKEVELPLENIKKKLQAELLKMEIMYENSESFDSRLEGMRFALDLISKEAK